jgi:predicted ATPase
MIRSLHLGNFKAFAETQDIPVRPLTLIFGPNSAGKSSVIHGLALAHHAILTGELDTQRTEIGGESIDLGGFRQYVHRRETNRQVEWTIELDTALITGRVGELLAQAKTVAMQFLIGEASATGVGVQSCVILADGTPLLTMSARGSQRLRIDRLDQSHPVLREVLRAIVLSTTTTQEVHDEDFAGIDEAVDALVPEISVRLERLLPHVEAGVSTEMETMQTLLFPVSQGERKEALGQAVRMFLPRTLRELVNGLSDAIEAAVGRLKYLGPLRSYPPRHLAFSAHHDPNWHAGGGSSWDVLRRDAVVRAAVNGWLNSPQHLSTPYEVVVRDLIALDQLDGPLHDALVALSESENLTIEPDYDNEPEPTGAYPTIKDVDAEVESFKTALRMADIDRITELVLTDRRSNTVVTHRDVGIGVSQVLPVLVNAYGLRNNLLAIEQPEIHLHPALQAELGDVFINSALGASRNTFLLETHSEHLLLRIMRRMRETSQGALPEGFPSVHLADVMVLYVEPDGPRSIIREMPLNERGELVKAWPGGFFEEGLREIF